MDKTIKTGRLYRTLPLDRAAVNEKTRTVELSFSSETPIDRWFGKEILDHSPGAVRMERLNAGAPVMVDHRGDQVGVVEGAAIGADRKGRAVVRFGKSARADEVFQDVRDGIRRNVSIGYQIHDMTLVEENDGQATYRATDWEPLEVSLVGVPADISVGVGREQHDSHFETTVRMHTMENNQGAVAAERMRASEIRAMGQRFSCEDVATAFIDKGASIEEMRTAVLERLGARPIAVIDPKIGLSSKEARSYRFTRLIHAQATGDWRGAEFERECSQATAKQMRREPQGAYIPYDVLGRSFADNDDGSQKMNRALMEQLVRTLTKGTGSAGGFTVATDVLAASFIELIRNRMMTRRLGATILGGLVGDVAIPALSGAATAYWVAENAAPTASTQTIGQVGMSPKTVGGYTDISRRLILQSSIDVEAMVRTDLALILALEIDRVAIHGTGAGQPAGILQTTGIGSVVGGSAGATPSWANVVSLETAVANLSADMGALAYLTNSRARGLFKQTAKIGTTYPIWIWEDDPAMEPGMGVMNGYRAAVSNQVSNTLTKSTCSILSAIIFGNWRDLIIAEWGALDILVDPYTGSNAGTIRVRALQDTDVAVRHVGSFAAMTDAKCG